VAIVSRRAQKAANNGSQLPLLGVLGAFVFAAQMVNFPVGIGTSGHLVGGTLLACIIGPWAAALVMTSILVIQALVFQDGGVLALGANIINMALLGVVAGYVPARLLSRTKWNSAGVFLGGTLSVLVSGVLALSELLLSRIRMPPAMIELSLIVFAVNALVEGAITLSALRAIERLKPGVSVLGAVPSDPPSRPPKLKTVAVVIASVSILIAGLGVAIGSTLPDGLERLALRLGIPLTVHPLFHAPLSDYYVRQLGMNWASRASAGLLGLLCIYAICGIGSHLLGRSRRSYS
jgi:cobalt/nickel transport system permease protein